MTFVFNGIHLMVDAVVSDPDSLVRPDLGIKCIESIVENIDLTMILPPVTVKFPHAISEMNRVVQGLEAEGLGKSKTAIDLKKQLKERDEESYGYSTFAMIAESHLSSHTFPELSYFSFDCYSCKSFNVDSVINEIEKHFNIVKLEKQVAKREVPDVSKI